MNEVHPFAREPPDLRDDVMITNVEIKSKVVNYNRCLTEITFCFTPLRGFKNGDLVLFILLFEERLPYHITYNRLISRFNM